MERTIRTVQRLHGVLKVPGDKSISHRALVLGVLAKGKHVIEGLSPVDDVQQTVQCMRRLGCFVETMPDGRVLVFSHHLEPEVVLHAGNSGTTARLLAALSAGLGVTCTVDGDESLRKRPMDRVAEPLSAMGATITLSPGGTLPMSIRGGGLTGIRYALPVPSAQVKSALLMAGLLAAGETTVVERVPTRNHTEILLRAMGVNVKSEGGAVTVRGGSRVTGTRVAVPGDFSSAAYFLVAAVCLRDSEVYLPVTGVNPTRTGLVDTLREMGAEIAFENQEDPGGEPVADVYARSSSLKGVTVDDPARIAFAIDELPILAVAATQAGGTTRVRGAAALRVRETNRITAMTRNLTAMGADMQALADGFVVRGPTRLKGARVSSFGDHRIAMATAVAALLADGETVLDDYDVVDVSYPHFFVDLTALVS